jgi:hypothetical protein
LPDSLTSLADALAERELLGGGPGGGGGTWKLFAAVPPLPTCQLPGPGLPWDGEEAPAEAERRAAGASIRGSVGWTYTEARFVTLLMLVRRGKDLGGSVLVGCNDPPAPPPPPPPPLPPPSSCWGAPDLEGSREGGELPES